MDGLEKYYAEQEKWIAYSSLFDKEWELSEFSNSLLIKLDNKSDLAKVIYYHLGESSINWIDQKIPALKNLTPLECLKTEETTNRLKECLMRML